MKHIKLVLCESWPNCGESETIEFTDPKELFKKAMNSMKYCSYYTDQGVELWLDEAQAYLGAESPQGVLKERETQTTKSLWKHIAKPAIIIAIGFLVLKMLSSEIIESNLLPVLPFLIFVLCGYFLRKRTRYWFIISALISLSGYFALLY